jgi:hypothetical protein
VRTNQASVTVDDGSPAGADKKSTFPFTPTVGEWSQIGFVFSRSAQRITSFVDAQYGNTVDIAGDYPIYCDSVALESLRVGCAKPGLRHALMEIARLRIFNWALSSAEIISDYTALASIPTYRDNFDFCPVTLATVGGFIGGEVSRSGYQCVDTVGRWDLIDAPDSPRGRVISCSVGGKLRLPLQGAANFGTSVFDSTGTASLAKLAHSLEITASAGATIRQVELTVA